MSMATIGPAGRPQEDQAFLQALTTEHFTLQTARAVAVNESNGRGALYIGALSSTLFTLPSAVAMINGLLGGVTVALAVATAVGLPPPATVLSGMVSGTAILVVHVAYQVRRFARMRATVAARFPSQVPHPTAALPLRRATP